MDVPSKKIVTEAKEAAIEVLLHNMRGPFHQLPRTAGWGYPEPYTRDLMISALGMLVSGNSELIDCLRNVLETLAKNQTEHGHIPSLVHDPEDRGASDTTPLFLMALGLFRKVTGEKNFLEKAAHKAFSWLISQSPTDRVMIAQQPTSDWRDEQWVLGYGLYVNAVYYHALRLFGRDEKAAVLRHSMGRFVIQKDRQTRHVHEGLIVPHKPYYAMWTYKIYSSPRFDLLGNCLSILTGIASPSRAKSMIQWIETECKTLQSQGELAVDFPPCLFPYIRSEDPDWRPRYQKYNRPGEYHNGGIWPFIGGFYVASLLASGFLKLAQKKLLVLTELVRLSRRSLNFGFNEWIRAQDGSPRGEDWQTWSAAMYLYAAKCVEQGRAVFF